MTYNKGRNNITTNIIHDTSITIIPHKQHNILKITAMMSVLASKNGLKSTNLHFEKKFHEMLYQQQTLC